jgi:hypothetical protein
MAMGTRPETLVLMGFSFANQSSIRRFRILSIRSGHPECACYGDRVEGAAFLIGL